MTDKDFSKDILQQIKEKQITPKPKWEFLLKDSAVWTAGIVSLVVGGITMSVIIHLYRFDDLETLTETGGNTVQTILILLPYFWIAVLGVFVLVAHYNLKHTKNGYKYKVSHITIATVLISAALGVLFYDTGLGRAIDHVLSNRMPTYDRYAHPWAKVWSNPDQGRIAGTVVRVIDQNHFELKDFHERVWIVYTSNTLPQPLQRTPRPVKVRCRGQAVQDRTFQAIRIMPWIPKHQPIMKFRMEGEREATPQTY
ncbi:hypothetical protein GF380_04420 [Candidatus Uhrbacteria bacterium]|nr:hypothetical protein [Candidatus Uhrbacteria bacterium]MBD3284305.1 hypothetical protein [Candidatus Uhrbacteria bacterium]